MGWEYFNYESRIYYDSWRSYLFLGNAITLLASHAQKTFWLTYRSIQKKYAKTIIAICILYMVLAIGILYKDLGKLIPAISFYAITLTGTGFLSVLLWLEQKEKTTFAFMSGVILIIISGTLLAVKLFVGNNLLIETLIRLLYIVAQFLICFYFKKSINTL